MMLDNKVESILAEFSSDYNKKIYGREIARKLKMNQKTVSNLLNKLEKDNILKFSQEGKNKYYFLNKLNPKIKEIIKLIEINRKINFLEKYKKIRGIFEKLEERTRGILIIFGSYANFSSHEKSDIDVLIIGKVNELKDLEQIYELKINAVNVNKNKFDVDDSFIKEIIKNHIILRGIEDFVDLIW